MIPRKARTLATIIGLTALVFILDVFTPVEWAMWLFYIVPLLLASRIFNWRQIYILTAVYSFLIPLNYFLPPFPITPVSAEITMFNGTMGTLMLWLVAYLLVRHKKADESAQELEEKFLALVDESPVGTFLVQGDRFVYFNSRLRAMYGYAEEELKGVNFFELIHPDDRAVLRDNLLKMEGGDIKKFHYEVRGLKKDGGKLSVEIIGSYTMFNGKPAFMGTVVDMPERKSA